MISLSGQKKFLIPGLIALVIAVVFSISLLAGGLTNQKTDSLDFFFRLRPTARSSAPIVFVEISDSDIAKIGRWPWNRSWHAAITKALKDLGAKQIYFDVLFCEKSSEANDQIFSESLDYAKNVYLPFAFTDQTYSLADSLQPIPSFSKSIKATGSINITPDPDGIFRQLPLIYPNKTSNPLTHIALKLALDYTNEHIVEIKKNAIFVSNFRQEKTIPLVNSNSVLINWYGPWKKTFTHYSFLQVLNAYKEKLDGQSPSIDLKQIKDSICIIAVTGIGLYDIKPTPLEPQYPGVGALATVTANIIDNRFIQIAPQWLNIFLIFCFAFIPILLLKQKQPFKEIFALSAILVLLIFCAVLFFQKSIWLDFAVPGLVLFLSYLSISFYGFVQAWIAHKYFTDLSNPDPETKLFTIRYFNLVVEAECETCYVDLNHDFCVVLLEIIGFKELVEQQPQIGQLIIKETGEKIQQVLRCSDILAQSGSNQLILLLRGVSCDNADSVIKKVEEFLHSSPVIIEKNSYKISFYKGIAGFKKFDTQASLISRCNKELLKTKNNARE